MTDTRVKTRLAQLTKIFKELPENKRILLKTTIETVAFMDIQMKDLEKVIISGESTTPEKQLYTSLAKTRDGLIKKLLQELPDGTTVEDELDLF